MYLPSIVNTGSLLISAFWGFIIDNHNDDTYKVPPAFIEHLKQIDKKTVQQIENEFKLKNVTLGRDTISFSSDQWWEGKRTKIRPLVDLAGWKNDA